MAAAGVHQVRAAGDGQPGIVVGIQPPEHVVAVEPVLLNAQEAAW